MTAIIWGPVVSTPHPDAIAEALGVLEAHGGHAGPHPHDALRCVLAAVRAWEQRHEAEERAHAQRRDDPRRLVETKTLLNAAQERGEARAHARVRVCLKCQDKLTPEGTER